MADTRNVFEETDKQLVMKSLEKLEMSKAKRVHIRVELAVARLICICEKVIEYVLKEQN